MMFQMMNDQEKKCLRERNNSEMSNKSSGSDDSCGTSSLNYEHKLPLMKMVISNVNDLQWDMKTGLVKEDKSEDGLM